MRPLEWIASVSPVTVLGMGFLAAGLGVVVGFLHRAYTGSRVPFFAPVIVGLGAVGLWINSASALILFVSSMAPEATEPLVVENVETNLVTALAGAIAAYGGGRAGDRLAPNLRALAGSREVDTNVNRLVRTIGRFITVSIPERIEDIDGYEAVDPETKSKLAGIELRFPRGLTVDQLRDRISDRLREDYGVGRVDVDVDAEGTIEYLAVGSRTAGLGPTLPPRRVGIAVTTNPPPRASPGDRIQLWELPEEPVTETESDAAPESEPDPIGDDAADPAGEGAVATAVAGETGETRDGDEAELPAALVAHPDRWYRPDSATYDFAVRTPDGGRRYRTTAAAAATLVELYYGSEGGTEPSEAADDTDASAPARRVVTAELRATSGDVATLAVDVGRVGEIDQSKDYRIVTLRGEKNPDREFAALLRSADETMESVRIGPESPLEGVPVGALRPSVVGARPQNGPLETLPAEEWRPTTGDTLYVVGRHDELRKLSAASNAG